MNKLVFSIYRFCIIGDVKVNEVILKTEWSTYGKASQP